MSAWDSPQGDFLYKHRLTEHREISVRSSLVCLRRDLDLLACDMPLFLWREILWIKGSNWWNYWKKLCLVFFFQNIEITDMFFLCTAFVCSDCFIASPVDYIFLCSANIFTFQILASLLLQCDKVLPNDRWLMRVFSVNYLVAISDKSCFWYCFLINTATRHSQRIGDKCEYYLWIAPV